MLRVGLTGGLGSGKSTVAAMFARHGVYVLHADEIGRELTQPGQPVYREISQRFEQCPSLILPDGHLDRAALAHYAFSTNRLDELNRIVHPAVIAEQERRMAAIFQRDPDAIVMVESALMFEADHAGTAPGLSRRFDKLILVTAPESVRLTRYVARASQGRALSQEERSALEQDGRKRMAFQIPDGVKVPLCDFVIENSGPLERVEERMREVLAALQTPTVAARDDGPAAH